MSPNLGSNRVVVIGGGVIGGLTAYCLNRKGWSVTVVEQGRFGHGASWGNCGLIVPSHVVPLNTPENLKAGLRWMLRTDAPLRIRPSIDPDRIGWFLRFARNCTTSRILRASAARAAMLRNAATDYRAVVEQETMDCDFDHRGALHVFLNRRAFAGFADTDAAAHRFGMRAVRLERSACLEHEPALCDQAAGAWYDPTVAQLRPDRFMAELQQVLMDAGVSLLEGTGFRGFGRAGRRASAAITDRGSVPADAFVVATGAWTPLLHQRLGVKLPIQPGKGYSVTMTRSGRGPTLPCFFEAARVVATPWRSGFRLGGTMEFAGFDDTIDRRRIAPLFRTAAAHLRAFRPVGIEAPWCGWRPMTVDGLPIIDRLPGWSNVVVAAGHNMIGLSMGPATGRLVAELLSGETPFLDPTPYRLSRFRSNRHDSVPDAFGDNGFIAETPGFA